jgi:hypothetical protein
MLSISRLRRYPCHFQTVTGLSIAQFDDVLDEITPAYNAIQQQKQERDDRQRSIGAGRPFVLPLADRLLIGLVHLRLQPSFRLLSDLFGMDRGNIHREIHQRLLPVLNSVSPIHLRDVLIRNERNLDNQIRSKRNPMRSLQQLIDTFPELQEVLLDATEHALLHPADRRTRHCSRTEKSKNQAIKDQNGAQPTFVVSTYDAFPDILPERTSLRTSSVSMQKRPWLDTELERAFDGPTSLDSSGSAANPGLAQQDYHPIRQAA